MVQTGIRQYYYTSKKAWSLLKVGLLDSSLVPLSVLEYGNANKKLLVKTPVCVSCMAMSDTL